MQIITYKDLKAKHDVLRANLQDALNMRIHRAISWLQAAQECPHQDGKFIYLWVAFNAAYAHEVGKNRNSESVMYKRYLRRIVSMDAEGRLYDLIWHHYSGAIRVLLANHYVFQPYWDWANASQSEREHIDWQQKFSRAKSKSHKALANNNVFGVLEVIFNRLYTLRNQLIHGGATFNSSVNRAQISDACKIMQDLIPIIIDLMMTNSQALWGEAIYPLIKT